MVRRAREPKGKAVSEAGRALLVERAKMLAEVEKRERENRLVVYSPTEKQGEFHAAGRAFQERMFMAANRSGKTMCACHEVAMHTTGLYPAWWVGRRFEEPSVWWVAGETAETTRDSLMLQLFGRQEELGTGAIPKRCIGKTVWSRSASGLLDYAQVKHVSGGWSYVYFRSYGKERERWQAVSLDGILFDEEPPFDVYSEGRTRTFSRHGLTMTTFTPLEGMSSVVRRFLTEKDKDRRSLTTCSLDEATFLNDEHRTQMLLDYPEHEREARYYGKPMLGAGRVFPTPWEDVCCEPVGLPAHWARVVGLDIGYDHPTAAVWLAWDRDSDTVFVTDAYRRARESVPLHASAIRGRGAWIPVAWPHDAFQSDKGSGHEIAEQYRLEGVNMLPERAQFLDGSFGLEAGVSEMYARFQSGKMKIFSHLNEVREEYETYHRKDGKIVKEFDDLMAAIRYGLMSLRFAVSAVEARQWSGAVRYVAANVL